MAAHFEVFVSKEDFKFHCAHFIAYPGFRERLHGHNYHVSVKVVGEHAVGTDGYLLDFGDIKKETRKLCKSLNEYFICPTLSPSLKISQTDGSVCLECEDGSKFSFPRSDCVMLPILHSSAEELAHFVWCELIKMIGFEKLARRGIKSMEIGVAEAKNQMATYKAPIPLDRDALEVFLKTPLPVFPRPCFDDDA